LRIVVIAVGYFIALFGALSIFRIHQLWTLIILCAGLVLVAVGQKGVNIPKIDARQNWFFWLAVRLLGATVIVGILLLIGEDRIRQWTPHPAGYVPAWLILVQALQHLQYFYRYVSTPPKAA